MTDEELTEQLAEALRLMFDNPFGAATTAARLLPVVRRAQAQALREAAEAIEALSSHAYDEDDEAYEDAARRLRDRADALEAER